MKKLINAVLVIFAFLLQGCAYAPFSNDYTGRSLGKKNFGIQTGVAGIPHAGAFPFIRAGYGATENFDIGVLYEQHLGTGPIGIWMKYALLNQEEGVSIAVNGSIGGSGLLGDSGYAFVGPTLSYKCQYIEPYISARFNYVEGDTLFDDRNDSCFDDPCYNYHQAYGSITVGNTFWIAKGVGINLNIAGMTRNDLPSVYYGAGVVLEF